MSNALFLDSETKVYFSPSLKLISDVNIDLYRGHGSVWVAIQTNSTLLLNELTSVIFQFMHTIISRLQSGSLWFEHSLIWTVLELMLTNRWWIFCQNHTPQLRFLNLCGFLFQKCSFLWNWQKGLIKIHKKKYTYIYIYIYGEIVFDITGSIKVFINITWTTKMCLYT